MQTSREPRFLTALDFFFFFFFFSPSLSLSLCPLTPFPQRSELHVVEPHSTDVCIQLDTESPGRAPGDVASQAGSVRRIQVSAGRPRPIRAPRCPCLPPLQSLTSSSPLCSFLSSSTSSSSCSPPVAGATATILATIH